MSERLYPLRHDQGHFLCGLACGKQVLLRSAVHEIIAHWFDMNGRLIEVERVRMAVDPPTWPGTTIYQTGIEYDQAVDAAVAAFKEQIGFRSANIAVRAFLSEAGAIVDLPFEYEEFLKSPESAAPEEQEHFPRYIAEWRAEGRFVLECGVDYWLSADGQVLAHG